MEKKSKYFIIFGFLFAIVLLAYTFFGLNRGRTSRDIERSGIDTRRVKRLEDKLVNVRDHVENSAEKIKDAGGEVTESLGIVGQVKGGFDTIERGIEDCKNRVGNIEKRHSRIEQIILKAKKRKDSLDDNCN